MSRAASFLIFLTSVAPSAAAAQSTNAASSSGEDKTKITVEIEVAPEWATTSPLTFEDASDATTASLAISGQHKFSDLITLDVRIGPSARLDEDEDDKAGASSSFGASGELTLAATQRIGFFGSVGYKANFTDFFDDDAADERNYSAGVKYALPILYIDDEPSTTFNARAFYTLTDSDNDANDNEVGQVRLNWANPSRPGVCSALRARSRGAGTRMSTPPLALRSG